MGVSMHKKLILLIIICIALCGCTQIKDMPIDGITERLYQPIKVSNVYHTGYKYYLPSTMQVTNYLLYNDVIEDSTHHYYLYVSEIDYYNKVENSYKVCNNCYFSRLLNKDKNIGYLEINLHKNGQYLIEIMYNYAKIEVMVDKSEINEVLTNAVTILRSIKYNDTVINNLMGEDVLSFQEESYNIFNTTSTDGNYLKFLEEDQYEDPLPDETNNTTLIE